MNMIMIKKTKAKPAKNPKANKVLNYIFLFYENFLKFSLHYLG